MVTATTPPAPTPSAGHALHQARPRGGRDSRRHGSSHPTPSASRAFRLTAFAPTGLSGLHPLVGTTSGVMGESLSVVVLGLRARQSQRGRFWPDVNWAAVCLPHYFPGRRRKRAGRPGYDRRHQGRRNHPEGHRLCQAHLPGTAPTGDLFETRPSKLALGVTPDVSQLHQVMIGP